MDVEYTNAGATFDRWASLPDELSNPSFFITTPEHTIILDLFSESNNQENLDKLLSSVLLSKVPISLPSLFARVWTTMSYPTRVRATALYQYTQHVKGKSNLDFQGFIPHLIAALSDDSKDIRDTASKALTALHQTYSLSTKHSVLGLMELYSEDSTAALKWLSMAEAKWLVDSVVSRLAECQLDCKYIVRLLVGILNRAAKKGKKEQYCLQIFYSNLEILHP